MTSGSAQTTLTHVQGRANPTGLAALFDPEMVESYRNVLCDQYDDCLDEALRQRWPSWSCEYCQMFVQDAVSRSMRVAHEAVNRPDAEL